MIRKKKYDIIYSLGSNCACALYLNKYHLRLTSGPFDWVSEICFENRISLILNDFKDYLKISNLVKITPDNKDVKHEIYKNKKTGCVFPHDFTLNLPLQASYDEVYNKYKRRIERFYNNIQQKEKVLLIWFSLDMKISDKEILKASKTLNKKFNKEIDLLIIEHNDDLFNQTIQTKYLNQCCIKISLFAKNKGEIADFTKGNKKVCGKIFKNYSVNRPWFDYLKIFLIKRLCSLIPIKQIRKNIRNRLLYGKN